MKLPGDTFEIKTSKVFRMQTLKTPIMDSLWVDTYFFYVPNRIVWEHWANFLGENSESAWIPQTEYTIPQLESPEGGWDVGTIADYLGIPPDVEGLSINALPFRGYAKIVDEWFRDENLQDPVVIDYGDSTLSGSNGTNYVTDLVKGSYPFIAGKMHDYFTSALPAPLKGPEIGIPVAQGAVLPVFTAPKPNAHFLNQKYDWSDPGYQNAVNSSYPIQYEVGSVQAENGHAKPGIQLSSFSYDSYNNATLQNSSSGTVLHNSFTFGTQSGKSGINKTLADLKSATNMGAVTPVNLVADGSALMQFTTINDLRQAFAIQRFYERQARSGSRYREIIASMFQVSIGDVRAMIPEYLGGNRLPLNVRQITQTSSNVQGQPLGDVAGMSVTNDNHFDFVKSFTEHGYVIGLMVARYKHTYQQGIEPTFLRKTKFDYYFPVFAHLGEQPIRNEYIYAQGTDTDKEVFGYQEAWADYRYKPDRVSSMMRSMSESGLDTWHFADDYASLPHLSADWIKEDKSNVDRTLTVSSGVSNQIFADILVTNHTTRPMPLYSIPGLIDHF